MTTPPRKVLVVDDNVINQKVVVQMLKRSDILPDVALDGSAALQMVKQQRYDLIFMDIQMPVMDGLEATRAIREYEAGRFRTPIIAVTANAMQGDRERCLESGMDDYLTKPVMLQQIQQALERWMQKESANDSEEKQKESTGAEPVIDPKRIEQIIDVGDNDLLKELLSIYLEDLDQFVADIRSAVTEQNYQRMYECSHKLKGASSNLGIESLARSCAELEQMSKAGDTDAVTFKFSQLQELISRVRAHITAEYF